MDATGIKGGGERNWEIGVDTYTLQILYIKQITNENLLYTAQETLLNACGDLIGKEIQGEDICLHLADSFFCTVETNKTL